MPVKPEKNPNISSAELKTAVQEIGDFPWKSFISDKQAIYLLESLFGIGKSRIIRAIDSFASEANIQVTEETSLKDIVKAIYTKYGDNEQSLLMQPKIGSKSVKTLKTLFRIFDLSAELEEDVRRRSEWKAKWGRKVSQTPKSRAKAAS